MTMPKAKCDRCGITRGGFRMSMFNQDWCCEICIEVERTHPDYNKAREIEREEVIKGNTNYEGVGLPDGYDTWAKEQRLRLLHEDERLLLLQDALTDED